MRVNLIKNISFKQIKLTDDEYKEAELCLKQIIKEPENFSLNDKMFDLFESHLNNEVELKKYTAGKDRRYFSKNLYVKFFDILKTAKNSNQTIEKFITNLNNYIERFNLKRNVENDDENLLKYNVSGAQISAHKFYTSLGITKEEFLDLANKVPFFSYKSGKATKKDMYEICQHFGFESKECKELYKKNPQAILRPNQWIINNAQNNMKILKINDIEDYKIIVKNNPLLLTSENLEEQIKILTEFLDTETENVITIIKTQPQLANMNIDYIKRNFYAMKDYLNVSREKMSDIALLAPVTIKDVFILNKTKYESIAETLGISMKTFTNRANHLPAIYRITNTKLERYLEFLSKKLDITREEAIRYISNNLNILSYNFSNMTTKTEDNFYLLKEELDFDYKAYQNLILKNAWLLGHIKELVHENIINTIKYFNIDKATFTRLINKNPLLITYTTKNVIKNILESAEMINVSEEEYKQMCLIEPLLTTKSAKYHHANLPISADALGISEYDFIKYSKKNPKLLTTDFDSICEIKKRLDFSKNIGSNIELDNLSINNEELFFEATLLTTIAGILGLSTKDIKSSAEDIISKCKNKILELKIPKHELTEKFTNFTKKFLKDYNLESKCKLIIK